METIDSRIIDLEQRRLERRPQVVRLAPELDGHGALLNIGFGPSELIPHPILAWALNEDDSCVGMVLHCGTLAPVTQFATRFQGYTDPELSQLSRTPLLSFGWDCVPLGIISTQHIPSNVQTWQSYLRLF